MKALIFADCQRPITRLSKEPPKLKIAMIPTVAGNPFIRLLKCSLSDEGVSFLEDHNGLIAFRWLAGHAYENVTIFLNWPSALYTRDSRIVRFNALMLIARLSLARLFGYRVVWLCHNLWPHSMFGGHWAHKSIRTFLARASSLVIFLSEQSKRQFDVTFRTPKRSLVINHAHFIGVHGAAVDRDAAREFLRWGQEERVSLIGRLRGYKGLALLLEASKDLSCQGIRICVAGQPTDEAHEYLNALGKLKGIDMRLGWLSDADLVSVLCGSDAIVFPFTEITNSGSVILALSYGAVCVIPDLEEFTEQFEQDAVIYFKAHSAADLSRASIRACSLGAEERQELKRRAVETVIRNSWEKCAKEIVRSLISVYSTR